MKKLKLFSLLTIGSAIMFSCGGSKGGDTRNQKSLTGWKDNDSKGWYFQGKQNKQQNVQGMVYVEGGTFTMGIVKDDVIRDWNNTPRRMQVSSFYIGEAEVTNHDYKMYLTWLKYVFPPSDPQYRDIYTGSLPDTLNWDNELARNEFSQTYFRSPQYDNYPVVGVSWTQANNYCDWLTDRANERVLMQKGIISKEFYTNEEFNLGAAAFNMDKFRSNDPEMEAYLDKQRLHKNSGLKTTNQRMIAANGAPMANLIQPFRLPTEVEWEFAALALTKNRDYNNYLGKDPKIDQLRGKKGRNKGMFLANFKQGHGDYSGVSGWDNDGSSRTSSVRQYPANGLGIYGMYGNVAEWVADVYRPIIDTDYNDIDYYRGNKPQRLLRNSDGTYKKVTAETIQYDTLADGRLTYRSLPGKFARETVKDHRNFRDGDKQSSLDFSKSGKAGNHNMYNAPRRGFVVDENGVVIMQKDTKNRTSTITNEVRVVKGGSWKDTAYWLEPGQRRYKDQNKAYGWIGFRVAQDAGRRHRQARTKR